jgi:hypothetical protein
LPTQQNQTPTIAKSIKDTKLSTKKTSSIKDEKTPSVSELPRDVLVTNIFPRLKTITKDLSLRQQMRIAYAMNDRKQLKLLQSISKPEEGEIYLVKVERMGDLSIATHRTEELSKESEFFSSATLTDALKRFHKLARHDALAIQRFYPKYVSKGIILENDYIFYQYDLETEEHMIRLIKYPKIRLIINTKIELAKPVIINSIIIDVTKYKDYKGSPAFPKNPIFEDLLLGVDWMKNLLLKGKTFKLSKNITMGTCENVPIDKTECLDLLEKIKNFLIS